MQLVFQILLTLVALFLILLVLVQRGRGGGLAGALGGMGGSSAFGAKAGDVFTRITVVAAAVWILLCIAAAKLGPATAGSRIDTGNESRISTGPELTPPAEGETESPDESPTTGNSAAGGAGGESDTETSTESTADSKTE